jgi:hypothetical protein
MQIELTENPLILPTRDAQTNPFAQHCHQGSSCVVRGASVNDETMSAEAQVRLLLSWRAVLGNIGSSELGAGQW